MTRVLEKMKLLRPALCCLLLAALPLVCHASDAAAVPKPAPLVLLYQPLASPGGALAAALQRDRILRHSLVREGFSLQMVPVRDGGEAVKLIASGAAAVSTLGDMPLLKAAGELPLYAVALIKQNYVTVVGPKGLLPGDLKGKKIGNNFGSSGHFALIKTLAGSGLSESDAVLVPMEVTEMEEALLGGRIAAYAAWTPTPEITLGKHPERFAAIGRQKSLAFMVLAKPLADRHPELPLLLSAALVRAMNWLSKDAKALELAAGWNLKDIGLLKGGLVPQTSQARLARDLRRDLVAISHTPRLPSGIEAKGSYLYEEFCFLQRLGKIQPTVTWPVLQRTFKPDYVDRVLKNAKKYQTARFDYEPN